MPEDQSTTQSKDGKPGVYILFQNNYDGWEEIDRALNRPWLEDRIDKYVAKKTRVRTNYWILYDERGFLNG